MTQAGVWKDFVVADDGLVALGKEHGLQSLQLRVFGDKHHMPQVVESDEWLTVAFVIPYISHGVLKYERLYVLLGSQQVITLHNSNTSIVEKVRERIALTPRVSLSPSGVLAIIADTVTEAFTPVIDFVDEVVDRIEDAIVGHPTDAQLHQLFRYKKLLVAFRRVVLPTTALLDTLSDRRYKCIEAKYVPYLRDSYSYSWRTHELIDTLRDLLTSALDTYLSVVSNRMNDIMKRLTIVTTIFMPLSFLAGLGGMNFTHLPFGSDAAMYGIFGLMLLSSTMMIWYFKRRKWL